MAGDPVKLTSNDLSADLVGRKVYLRTDEGDTSHGVKIGASNNTTTDMNDLTAFTIESIDGSNVVLVYDGKYLSVSSNATVNFNSTSPNALTVMSNGAIYASRNNSAYDIYYDEWDGNGIYMTNTVANNPAVYMYLIPTVDHSYGELIPEVSADCEHEGMMAHYHCEVCGKYFDANKNEVSAESLVIPSSGQSEDVGVNIVRITTNMLPENDNSPTVDLFEGFEPVSWEEVSGWKPGVNDNFYVIYDYDESGFYVCAFQNGECVSDAPIYDTDTTNAGLRNMIANGTCFYYTVGSESGGQIGDVGLNAIRITTNMIPENDNPPTVDLFEGFESVSWEEVSEWKPNVNDDFYVIYDYDESGFYICHFQNGQCVSDAPIYNTDTTNAGLRNMIANGNRFYYTVGSESGGGSGNQGGEPVIDAGINAARITADMVPNNSDHPTADLFPGFQAVTWEEVITWTPSVNDLLYVIYKIDADGFYVCRFENGQCSLDESYNEEVHDTDTTNAVLLDMINNDLCFYYTLGSVSGGGSGNQGGEPVIDAGINAARITADMVPNNSDHPTADLFPGFQAVTWEEVITWTPSVNDLLYVIYDFDANGFYACRFENGQWDNNSEIHDTTMTNEDLFSIVSDGGLFYYTLGSVSGGGSGNQSSEPVIDAGINAARITADMVPNNSDHPTASLFPGFQSVTWEEVITWTPSVNDRLFVIYDFDENGFYICRFENGQCNLDEPFTEPYLDDSTTNTGLLDMLTSTETTYNFFYTLGSVSGGGSGNQGSDPSGNQGSGQSPEISLNDGQLFINASGYARSESGLNNPTPFVSSAVNPYLIENQEIYGCDNIIQVYQTDKNIETADIYIKLSNVTIEAGSWCSLFRIMATNTVNIHLMIEGDVTFRGGSGQQIFSSQSTLDPTVNIIIDESTFGGMFNAELTDGLTQANSGTINVSYQ